MIYRFFTALMICFSSLAFAQDAGEAERSRILYLLQAGNEKTALELYQDYYTKTGKQDLELLQQIGLILIEQGYRSREPEVQLLAIFGAGISANEKVMYILQEAITSPIPQLQLIALNFLSRYHNDRADESLNKAMASDYLLIRLEAALHLAEKKHNKAVGQIEALLYKVVPELLPIFPQLFALAGTDDAIKALKKMMNNSSEKVRVEAILSAAEAGRDDLLPTIRTLATQHSVPQQEACAWALGKLKDETSVPRLEILARSKVPTVRLAALEALYNLGRKEMRREVENFARDEDLFAITILGDMEGSQDVLFELTKSCNLNVKINAALSLLNLKDIRCLQPLTEILIRDARDLGFTKTSSPGDALTAWKVVPSAQENFKEEPIIYELSLHMREQTLADAINLPEKYFLMLAQLIFDTQQNELVPVCVEMLETLQTPAAISLLKLYQQKTGAPLIRNYCNLALYRLKEEGPYAQNLKDWIRSQQKIDMIQFRPFVPWEMREIDAAYQLTPHDASRLLVEAYETLASQQDEEGISILVSAIQNGNPKNKYALAGLLMHATQ